MLCFELNDSLSIQRVENHTPVAKVYLRRNRCITCKSQSHSLKRVVVDIDPSASNENCIAVLVLVLYIVMVAELMDFGGISGAVPPGLP